MPLERRPICRCCRILKRTFSGSVQSTIICMAMFAGAISALDVTNAFSCRPKHIFNLCIFRFTGSTLHLPCRHGHRDRYPLGQCLFVSRPVSTLVNATSAVKRSGRRPLFYLLQTEILFNSFQLEGKLYLHPDVLKRKGQHKSGLKHSRHDKQCNVCVHTVESDNDAICIHIGKCILNQSSTIPNWGDFNCGACTAGWRWQQGNSILH